ncbi:Cation/H(+) antiporter 18, partial [Cucurbita argyrosperma subsp. argyrosperma]
MIPNNVFNVEAVRLIYICATLAIVLAAGLVTDFIGIHAMFGAFVVGVLVRKDGPLVGAFVDEIEDPHNVGKDNSITHVEETIKSSAEAMETVQELKSCNLYLVGQTPDIKATFGLIRSECSETLSPVRTSLI